MQEFQYAQNLTKIFYYLSNKKKRIIIMGKIKHFMKTLTHLKLGGRDIPYLCLEFKKTIKMKVVVMKR
jgi:hypothetical protein